ncbi:MAG: signal peptide peptidase SppA [Deltaproteobacteria bacterium]|nr:signal peptide peptidase SppA [Deltaproteobacteria bacterium]
MDRKSVVVLGVIFGGLFLALFAFLLLAFVAVRSGGDDGAGFGGPAIGVLEIKGPIVDTDKELKALRKFAREDRIKSILVRIDSPGGAVAPSQEIYAELRRINQSKKVVCSMGNLAASGGYYIAAGCGKVFAMPGTLTGSIGVISQLPYLGDIAKELHFSMNTIKSGKMKDVGNPFREMTEEERAFFQKLMDSVHEQFISAVAEGRGLKIEEVRPFADGRVLTGAEARELKLVDEIGNFNDAIKLAAELGQIEGEPKLQYPPEEHRFKFADLMSEGGRALMRGFRQGLGESASSSPDGVVGPAYLMPTP